MSTYKDIYEKMTPEQRTDLKKQIGEVDGKQDEAAKRTKPEEWRDVGLMTDAQFAEFNRRATADSADTIREREAMEFAAARGFKVTKDE